MLRVMSLGYPLGDDIIVTPAQRNRLHDGMFGMFILATFRGILDPGLGSILSSDVDRCRRLINSLYEGNGPFFTRSVYVELHGLHPTIRPRVGLNCMGCTSLTAGAQASS